MSEADKNKADAYFKAAEEAYSAGYNLKAKRYLQRAENLHPSEHYKELLAKVQAASSGDGPDAPQSRTDEMTRSAPRQETLDYTPAQKEAVDRIINLKDYYEILGVPKDASGSDIQKVVRKLALEVHPDKNHAPRAEEAMKSVNYAAAVLLVPEQRAEYDRRRREQLLQDMTPEQMFNSFFNPESMPTLEQMMPWLMGAAGVALFSAGAYALYSALKEKSEPSAESGGKGYCKKRQVEK